jgi:hypothetical protein
MTSTDEPSTSTSTYQPFTPPDGSSGGSDNGHQ